MADNSLFIERPGIETIDGIGIYCKDQYWGKVPEHELIDAIKRIDAEGFESFTPKEQKKFDFTYGEDRADWRFFVPLNKNSVVLDIGAGMGRISLPLARVAGKVVSCDHSSSRMRFLTRRAKAEGLNNITTFVGDIYDLPLKEKSFDLIVLNGVLEWVGQTDKYADPREAQIQALIICRKLLKPGGTLYIGIENRRAMAYLKAPDHGGLLYTGFMPRAVANLYVRMRGKGSYRTYTYTKPGYEKLLREAGFPYRPEFFLLYPGYNFPRIILRYEDLISLTFLMSSFKQSKNMLRRLAQKLFSLPGCTRLYRYFFYSFGIITRV